MRSRHPIRWRPTDKAPQEAFGGISNRRDKMSRGIRHQYKNAEFAEAHTIFGWSQIDLRHGRLHVNRAKGGQESVHRYTARSSERYGLYKATVRMYSLRKLALRLNSLVPPDDPTDWRSCETAVPNSSAHASAQHWFQARQSGRGYSVAGALSRSPQSTIDGEIYGASA